MRACPSEMRLEAHLLDPGSSPVREHVASCGGCQERLEEMRLLTAEFRRFVYPATVEQVREAASPRRWLKTLLTFTPVPALAAAAALLLVVIPRQPASDYVGTKGDPLSLTVFARTLDGSQPLPDGGRVPPGTALRFQVHPPPAPCRLWLVSVDETSQVSRLYPTQGDEGADVTASGPLPGGAILDGRIGPERIFAICSPKPLPYRNVERAARVAAAGGAERVRKAQELTGLPAGVAQTTHLVEKAR